MIYVINIEDGGGQEFFLTQESTLVNLSSNSQEEPQEYKSLKLALKKRNQLRPQYADNCRIYALERTEFSARRDRLKNLAT